MSSEKMKRIRAWVAYTNTDCTEGRGSDVPIAVCELEVTAQRFAKNRYVQGTDGPVREIELIQIDGLWYALNKPIQLIKPSSADIEAQKLISAKHQAIKKAKEAGLTDEDIRDICS